MKKILLLPLLIFGFNFSIFAQGDNCNQTATSSDKVLLKKVFPAFKALDFKSSNGVTDNQKMNAHVSFQNLKKEPNQTDFMNKPKIYAYNMPCIKPQGDFAMRIYKPDPTVHYHMRVVGKIENVR